MFDKEFVFLFFVICLVIGTIMSLSVLIPPVRGLARSSTIARRMMILYFGLLAFIIYALGMRVQVYLYFGFNYSRCNCRLYDSCPIELDAKIHEIWVGSMIPPLLRPYWYVNEIVLPECSYYTNFSLLFSGERFTYHLILASTLALIMAGFAWWCTRGSDTRRRKHGYAEPAVIVIGLTVMGEMASRLAIDSWIGYGGLILSLILAGFWRNRQRKLNKILAYDKIWQKLAASNQLNFIAGPTWKADSIVTGDYRGRFLFLTTVQKDFWQKHIHISLKNKNRPGDEQTAARDISGFRDWAISHNTSYWRQLKIKASSQSIAGEYRGIEREAVDLVYTFDLLGDLLDFYPPVVALGAEAIPTLAEIIRKNKMLKPVARQMLKDIARETTARLASKACLLLCVRCLARCKIHKIRLPGRISAIYYGCRACGQSREFLDRSGGVVAVLDSHMLSKHSIRGGVLRVNWLVWRTLFDFDKVEIVQATDQDVERFAVQVGNDTETIRKFRYPRMPCAVAPDCELSPNTMRILQHIFGYVGAEKRVRSTP